MSAARFLVSLLLLFFLFRRSYCRCCRPGPLRLMLSLLAAILLIPPLVILLLLATILIV